MECGKVRSIKTGKIAKPDTKKKVLPSEISKSLKGFNEFFEAKIDVTVNNRGKGKISIPFDSIEDFNRIKKLLK